MSAVRRLNKELGDIKQPDSITSKIFKSILVDEANVLKWEGLLVCEKAPYAAKSGPEKGFRFELNFPAEYPFKPPKLVFKTKVYHPNVDDQGQVCLPIIAPENWKPATKAAQIVLALKSLIEEPETSGALRPKLADQYENDRKTFDAQVEEHVEKYAENVD